MKIICDSREQKPLDFRLSKNLTDVIKKKLNVGDYSIEGYEDKIGIERKSALDLFGTLGKGHKRFKKEIERVKALNMDYFGIVVECCFNKVMNKEFENSHYSNMMGFQIINTCYTYKMKHNIDIIFCNNRNEASAIIRNIFNAYLKTKGSELNG